MIRITAERKAKELRKKKAQGEKERKEMEEKGKGKGGKKGAQKGDQKGNGQTASSSNQPTQLDPHPCAQEYPGRSRQRSRKRNTSADRARKVHRSLSAFVELFGVL